MPKELEDQLEGPPIGVTSTPETAARIMAESKRISNARPRGRPRRNYKRPADPPPSPRVVDVFDIGLNESAMDLAQQRPLPVARPCRLVQVSSPSRPHRKSQNVPPARMRDDMFEYYPPVATAVKKEQRDTDEAVEVMPTKKRKIGTQEMQKRQEEIENRGSKQTYADIIKAELIKAGTKRLSLDEIYILLEESYPSKTRSSKWKDTVRRTLRQNDQFQLSDSCTGPHWRIKSETVSKSESESDSNSPIFQNPLSEELESVPGKVETDEVNEEDFDMGDFDSENLRKDITGDDTTADADLGSGHVHKKPVFQQVVVLPAGSKAQKKFLEILNMGTIPRSSTAVASENGHSYVNTDLKEDGTDCGACGRALKNFKSPGAHLRQCRQEKHVGNLGMCPKCGEIRNWRVPAQLKRHVETCDPIRRMCKQDHEHKFIDKTFETFEDAIAHFYDNEYDTELSISSGSKNKTKNPNDKYLLFTCGRSSKGKYEYQIKSGRPKVRKRLEKKCPAYIIMRGGWQDGRHWARVGTNENSAAVARMYGCTAHNHPDNPTMKRVSWLTKRRIAKFLLLGHSRRDIRSNLMPPFHVEGHKSVDLQCVTRIRRIMEEDKHHKLREGHDLASLLGKAKVTERGVYPWPSQTNCPLRNAARKEHFRKIVETKATKRAQKGSNSNGDRKAGSPQKSVGEREEVERAINSIEEENEGLDSDTPVAGNHTTEATRDDNVAPPGDSFVSVPESELNIEVTVDSSTNHIETEEPVGLTDLEMDDCIDPRAFETLRQKALRCLGPLGFPGTIAERLSPRISALEVSGAGMAELRRILQVVQQDLRRKKNASSVSCLRDSLHFLSLSGIRQTAIRILQLPV